MKKRKSETWKCDVRDFILSSILGSFALSCIFLEMVIVESLWTHSYRFMGLIPTLVLAVDLACSLCFLCYGVKTNGSSFF